MRTIVTILTLAFAIPVVAAAPAAVTPFEINGVRLGQPAADAQKAIPSMECERSCIAENQIFLGHTGRLWAELKDGKINGVAFRFRPALNVDQARTAMADIVSRHGPAKSNLGEENCDEWLVDGGFLAVCLTPEMSHIVWSHLSRVDVNKQH